MNLEVETVDGDTASICLEVPGAEVVALQGYFETYEGLGLVRTLDIRRSLVCVLTTPSMLDDCMALLEALRPEIGWRPARRPADLSGDRFLGYFKKERENA